MEGIERETWRNRDILWRESNKGKRERKGMERGRKKEGRNGERDHNI